VENVISGEVYQLRVRVPARGRQVSHRQGILLECRQGFLLRNIHLVIGRGVDHDGRIAFRDGALHSGGIRDIDGRSREAVDLVAARGKFGPQLDAQLTATAKQRDSLHLIANPLAPIRYFQFSAAHSSSPTAPGSSSSGQLRRMKRAKGRGAWGAGAAE